MELVCAVCGKLGGNLTAEDDKSATIRFHAECAVCYFCNKPGARTFVFTPDEGIMFIHEDCVFTPEQGAALMKMQSEYKPE